MSKMTKANIERARQLYEQGYSVRAIGKELGVSHTLVWRHVSETGQAYMLSLGPDGGRNAVKRAKQRVAMKALRAARKLLEG